MSEAPELRPVGTEFDHVQDSDKERVITRFRVTGYFDVEGMPGEQLEVVAIYRQPKPQIGGSERK